MALLLLEVNPKLPIEDVGDLRTTTNSGAVLLRVVVVVVVVVKPKAVWKHNGVIARIPIKYVIDNERV